MRRFQVPMAGFALVSGLATLLIGKIVLNSPDTPAHLWETLRPEYDRTAPIIVGQEAVEVELTLKRGRAEIGNPMTLDPGLSPAHGELRPKVESADTIPDKSWVSMQSDMHARLRRHLYRVGPVEPHERG